MKSMIIVWKYALSLTTLIAGTVGQDLSISLTVHPSGNGGKVISNSTVVLQCSVDLTILGRGDVVWYKQQGVNKYQLGIGGVMRSLVTAPRYHLQSESYTSSTAVYSLTITNVQLDDSATFECAAQKPSTRKAVQILAVCDDMNSAICDCTLRSGWTSPACIYAESADDGFERATVGLGVCLVVTSLFAVLATVIVVHDCRRKQRDERAKRAEREATLAHSTAVISRQTAASSAMKPHSDSTAAMTRPNVKFNDSALTKTDINC